MSEQNGKIPLEIGWFCGIRNKMSLPRHQSEVCTLLNPKTGEGILMACQAGANMIVRVNGIKNGGSWPIKTTCSGMRGRCGPINFNLRIKEGFARKK